MATKTITLTETAPGTFQVQGESGNPFAGSGAAAQSAALMGPPPTAQGLLNSYRAILPDGSQIVFASEADYLKANNFVRSLMQQPGQPIGAAPATGNLSSPGSAGPAGWLRTGAESAETVVGFLQGRALDRRITDLDESLDRLDRARVKLENLRGLHPDLVAVLLEVVDAERDATSTAQQILEDEISAVDIRTGAGAAKVIGQFLNGGTSTPSTGVGTTVAVGVGALGLGLLMSRDSDRRRRRR